MHSWHVELRNDLTSQDRVVGVHKRYAESYRSRFNKYLTGDVWTDTQHLKGWLRCEGLTYADGWATWEGCRRRSLRRHTITYSLKQSLSILNNNDVKYTHIVVIYDTRKLSWRGQFLLISGCTGFVNSGVNISPFLFQVESNINKYTTVYLLGCYNKKAPRCLIDFPFLHQLSQCVVNNFLGRCLHWGKLGR